MKYSGKMCLKIILKVTKNQGVTVSLEDTFFEKTTGGDPPSVLRLMTYLFLFLTCLFL